MDLYPEKKTNAAFFLFLFILALYVGYCAGTLYGTKISLENVITLFRHALLHPLPVRITPITSKSILICVLIWMIVCAYDMTKKGNYMPGREYGSGRLAPPKEINQRLMDKEGQKNKILSEHIRISTDSDLTNLNNNALIVGGPGAGKTFRLVKPNGYNCGESSYVFCDPKGELLRDTGRYLQMQGYTIKVLNLVDMENSDGYNPFSYIRSDEDITKLITNLIANTTPKGQKSSDPFWEKSEGMLLQALFLYVRYEFPKQGRTPNFRGVLELLNEMEVKEDGSGQSKLDERMMRLPENHLALINYKKVKTGAADTIRSIIISANARLAYLQNSKILHILDQDDMDIRALGEGVYRNPDRKTAMFCVIPDNDSSYSFIVGMFYTQLFQELYYISDHKKGGRLPLPVAIWMDEFANCALPEDFLKTLATSRGRGISFNIIIQNFAQLKAMYKDSWESITGDCDTLVYLGGNEQSTHKYMSELLGRITIDKKTSGESTGNHGSSSKNYDKLGRNLLDPSEVRKIPNDKCLIFIHGFDPVIDDKYHTVKKEEFKLAMALGPYERENDQDLQDGRNIFYLNCKGSRESSLYYQVEVCKGIFEESEAFSLFPESEEYMVVPSGRGYFYHSQIVFPVISKESVKTNTGMGTLTRHPLAGYSLDGEIKLVDEEKLEEIFCPSNRVSESITHDME